jgi:hypothetical protein
MTAEIAPVDWDGESYCANGCGNPATHQRLLGVSVDHHGIYDLVCCQCSLERLDA